MNKESETVEQIVNADALADLDRIRSITNIMDTRFKIPGTKITFGLDPLLGLIPAAGDIISYAISGLLVVLMARHKVKGQVVLLMLLNIGVDFLIGTIPVIGWIADFRLKANSRNLQLLEKHYEEGKFQRGLGNTLALILLFLIVFIWLSIWAVVKLFEWLF